MLHDRVTTYVGIDYGIRRVAWALIDGDTLWTDELVLPAPKRGQKIFIDQVVEMKYYLAASLLPLLNSNSVVAIESPITGASLNRLTAAQMAIVTGAILSPVTDITDDVHLVPSASWKLAATGRGDADKDQVRAVVQHVWGEQLTSTSQDVADAVGLAMWAQREKTEEQEG